MGNKQTEGPMEEDKEKNSGFSFMQEDQGKTCLCQSVGKKSSPVYSWRGFVWRNSASDLGAGIAADQ